MSEFNQCQNVLKELYNDGIKGNEFEFLGYRFLYYIYTKSNLGKLKYYKDNNRYIKYNKRNWK